MFVLMVVVLAWSEAAMPAPQFQVLGRYDSLERCQAAQKAATWGDEIGTPQSRRAIRSYSKCIPID